MVNVLIITEGGKDIGFGHVTRCVSICQAFEERKIAPEFIVNGDNIISGLLNGRKDKIFNWLNEREKLLEKIEKKDIVIVDSYLAPLQVYDGISKRIRAPIYIDDNKRLNYPKGFVINGSIYAQDINYPENKNITYLLGPQYMPLRKEFWNTAKKNIKKDVESIMVTFGGDDSKNMTPKIMEFLNKKYPKLRKFVIIGRAFRNIEKIRKLKDKKTNLIFNPSADEMKRVMMKSDIAISAGGQTLYELAKVGVPTIGICVAENQRMNLEGWHTKGFLEYIGWYDKKELERKLKHSIELFEDRDLRKQKSVAGQTAIDGKGSLRLAKILLTGELKNNLTIRRANFKDASNIFNLFNDARVRDSSFNPKKIEWACHLKWLREKLGDSNCIIFVVTHRGKFCGEVRFDIDRSDKATTNFSLVEEVRGLNLSSFILNKAIEKLEKHRSLIRTIDAYIKEKNAVSIKSFEGANFKFLKDTQVKGNRAKLYRWRPGIDET